MRKESKKRQYGVFEKGLKDILTGSKNEKWQTFITEMLKKTNVKKLQAVVA